MKKIFVLLVFSFFAAPALAATDCTFTTVGTTMSLDGDCMTDETIPVPDGFTLDGNWHWITLVDPAGDHFRGAGVANAGSEAHVVNLGIAASGLANACDLSGDRLRGIMFEGASGSILNNKVFDLNQGASGCQEGNAIEVRNAPFDGTHPGTVEVSIRGNTLDGWQKTGIVANGDVLVWIEHNDVGESATQANLAPNGIQLGFGAQVIVRHNDVHGNEWLGPSNFAGSGILLFSVDGVTVSQNNVNVTGRSGNADVGIFMVFVSNSTIFNNRVFDNGTDGPHGDFGIADVGGTGNDVRNNKVRGYDTPYSGVAGGRNKAIPGPQPGNVFFDQ